MVFERDRALQGLAAPPPLQAQPDTTSHASVAAGSRARLFGILMALTAAQAGACRCADPPSAADQVVRALGDLPAPGERLSEDWYRVEIQGQPAGFVHNTTFRVLSESGGGYLVRHHSEVAILRQDERAVIVEDAQTHEDEDGNLLRSRRVKTQPGSRDRLEAGRSGRELVTVVNDEVRREPLSLPLFALERLEWHLFRRGLRQGDRLQLRTFNSDVGGMCFTTIEVEEASSEGARLQADSCAAPGSRIAIRLDGEGKILDSVQTLGRLTIRTARAEGPLEVPRGVRLDELMFVRVQPPSGYPQNARRVRLRLSGLPESRLAALDGPGQRVVAKPGPGSFEIELFVPAPPARLSYPLVDVPPDAVPYLAPAAQVQSNHPEIVAAARQAVHDATDAQQAVQHLAVLVRDRLRSDMSKPNASALDAWRSRSGDCSEWALLLAALCRAAGIPARGAMGLVYTDGAFGYHMWNEVYLGGWLPVDAGLGGPPPRPTHLRLAIDSLLPGMATREVREAAAILGSDLGIEFVSMEPLLPAEQVPH